MENGRTNALAQDTALVGRMPVRSTSTGQQVQGGSGDGQALPFPRSARPAAPLPERRRLWEGSRRRQVGGGVSSVVMNRN